MLRYTRLVQEVAVRREDQCDAAAIRRLDDFRVAHGALRGDDCRTAGVRGRLQTVGEREEAVAGARSAARVFARALAGNLHRTHAIGLTGADAARGAAAHDDDPVAFDVPHD